MKYIGAIDHGTTSTRFIVFNEMGRIIGSSQLEHKQHFPKPGWVEHDPCEIRDNTFQVIRKTLADANLTYKDISAVGITNQRETVLAWNLQNGKIYHNAIVWQDLRGSELIEKIRKKYSEDKIKRLSGLVLSPYFSASKISWLLKNVKGLRTAVNNGEAVIGTMDSYLMWCLTGNRRIITDVTNASRYMLMNIKTLKWDPELLEIFDIPAKAMPEIVPSIGRIYDYTRPDGPFGGEVPLAGILGDQQSALFGQACFTKGSGKCTYGTGCFFLMNTGENLCYSGKGLLTTVAYMIDGQKPLYALEGSIAVAGSLIQWLRDNLKLIESAPQSDYYAEQVEDCGGVYIVPAFAGLFAPYWRSDARGVIAGLTGFSNKNHICRAALESTAFQVNDILKAIESDSKIKLSLLKVDGGLTNSRLLMKFQADILGIPVVKPVITETTALGCAYAAGISTGVFSGLEELNTRWEGSERYECSMDKKERNSKVLFWKKAVERTLNWTV